MELATGLILLVAFVAVVVLMARGGRYAELYETQFGKQAQAEDVVAA